MKLTPIERVWTGPEGRTTTVAADDVANQEKLRRLGWTPKDEPVVIGEPPVVAPVAVAPPPEPPAPDPYAAVPAKLKAAPRWVAYRPLDGRKPPVGDDGRPLEAWHSKLMTFADARERARKWDDGGVGFALGDGWGGLDLDDCRDPETKVLDPNAEAVLEQVPTAYAEVSPSKKGVKILGRGQGWVEVTFSANGVKSERKHFGYFTVTGDALPGRTGLPDLPLDAIAQVFGQQPASASPNAKRERPLPGGGVPVLPGGQEAALFRELCALRDRHLSEAAGVAAMWAEIEGGRLPNEPGREPWTRADVEAKARHVWSRYPEGEAEKTSAKRLVLTKATEFTPRSVRWLWKDRIPLGAPSLIAGRESHGKSTLAYERIARITRGQLEGEHEGKPKSVAVVATEDSWEHVIAPRLIAAGADLSRVFRVAVEVRDLGIAELSLPEDVPMLEEAVRENDVALILLDPLISRLGHKLDTHKDSEVRQALEPLAGLCDRTGCSALGIIHLNKTATTDPLTAVMGSRAFAAVVRAILFVTEDGEERLLSFEKNNYGPKAKSITFKIEGHKLDEKDPDGRDVWTSRVVLGGTTDRTARDVLEEAAKPRRGESKQDRAKAWLVARLKTEVAPVHSALIKREAKAAGFDERTLTRVLVDSRFEVTSSGRETFWSLGDGQGES